MIDTGLAGRVVVVTGATGGIGAAIARAFRAQGARLALHHLPAETSAPDGVTWEHRTPPVAAAEALAAELGDAVAVGVDLSRPDATVDLLDQVEQRLGPVDVLVNNAAHCESPDTVVALTAAGLERHYRVNAIAPALLTAELARRRRGGHAPCVVNVSTDAARAFPGQIGYGTSKAALEAFTRAAALDFLASHQARWVTGQVLQVAGGHAL
ncbi:SDR family oxidoreductase [Micromonospora echinospora]|uniref:SDR family NAD(P)-dependent oxidoreductase n=1 Tax=Micromonospora echinospora TaxID=1877 RepID=UPI0033C094FE